MARAVGGGERGQGRRTGKMDTCHLQLTKGAAACAHERSSTPRMRAAVQYRDAAVRRILLKTGARAVRAAAQRVCECMLALAFAFSGAVPQPGYSTRHSAQKRHLPDVAL